MDSYLKTFNLNNTEKGLSKLKKLKNPLDSFKKGPEEEKAAKLSKRVPVMTVAEEFKMEMKDDPTALICSPMNMSAKL